MKKNNSVLLSTPYIVFMVIFTLIPLGVVCFYALTDAAGHFTLDNIVGLGAYLPVLWQSILYSLAAAVICLLLGYPVAYFIAHCKPVTQARVRSRKLMHMGSITSIYRIFWATAL